MGHFTNLTLRVTKIHSQNVLPLIQRSYLAIDNSGGEPPVHLTDRLISCELSFSMPACEYHSLIVSHPIPPHRHRHAALDSFSRREEAEAAKVHSTGLACVSAARLYHRCYWFSRDMRPFDYTRD